jgi:hypothetical protein
MHATLDDTIIDNETTNTDVNAASTANVPAITTTAPPDTRFVDPLDFYLENEPGEDFFEGEFIFFNGQTGVWTRGPEKKPITASVPFLANPYDLRIGWIKLVDGKIIDRKVGRIRDGYQRLPREELDDFDERSWPRDPKSGTPQDPWKQVTYLPMQCQEDGEACVFGPKRPRRHQGVRQETQEGTRQPCRQEPGRAAQEPQLQEHPRRPDVCAGVVQRRL